MKDDRIIDCISGKEIRATPEKAMRADAEHR